MKPLSQSLLSLGERVKTLEDSAAAAIETDRTALEKRRHEIHDALGTQVGEFESAIDEAAAAGRKRWQETKASIARHVDEIQARYDKRHAEHELKQALRTADDAEEAAAAAVAFAGYALTVAEYAVIDAALARMAVDELAGEPTGSSTAKEGGGR